MSLWSYCGASFHCAGLLQHVIAHWLRDWFRCKAHGPALLAPRTVDGNKAEFDAKHMDMFDITEVLHESAAAIRRADEVAGEFREVHNVPDAER